MDKKIIIIALLALFLTATISSTSVVSKKSSNAAGSVIASPEISLELDSQLDEPISPSDTKTIDVTVKYRVDLSGLAAKFYFNTRIGRFLLFGFEYILKRSGEPSAKIDLSVECPDWCEATIEPSNVSIKTSTAFKDAEPVQLTISVDEDAPPLELGDITITAKSKALGSIAESTNKTTISVMASYSSSLEINATSAIEIPPINETTIPINITNNGNGETRVQASIETSPENWSISLVEENITISVGETKKIDLIVEPVKNFENETIQIKFTSMSTSDENVSDTYLQGETLLLDVTLSNDGSLKQEDEFPVFEVAAIVAVILIAAIAIIVLLLRRRKN